MTEPQSTSQDEHDEAADRLWRAIRRDLGTVILFYAGFAQGPDASKASERLERNWDKLCDLDIDIAARLYHGTEEVYMTLAKAGDQNGPMAAYSRYLGEVAGMVEIGRKANPDARDQTVGDLFRLGEEAVREDIDRDTGETAPPESTE